MNIYHPQRNYNPNLQNITHVTVGLDTVSITLPLYHWTTKKDKPSRRRGFAPGVHGVCHNVKGYTMHGYKAYDDGYLVYQPTIKSPVRLIVNLSQYGGGWDNTYAQAKALQILQSCLNDAIKKYITPAKRAKKHVQDLPLYRMDIYVDYHYAKGAATSTEATYHAILASECDTKDRRDTKQHEHTWYRGGRTCARTLAAYNKKTQLEQAKNINIDHDVIRAEWRTRPPKTKPITAYTAISEAYTSISILRQKLNILLIINNRKNQNPISMLSIFVLGLAKKNMGGKPSRWNYKGWIKRNKRVYHYRIMLHLVAVGIGSSRVVRD